MLVISLVFFKCIFFCIFERVFKYRVRPEWNHWWFSSYWMEWKFIVSSRVLCKSDCMKSLLPSGFVTLLPGVDYPLLGFLFLNSYILSENSFIIFQKHRFNKFGENVRTQHHTLLLFKYCGTMSSLKKSWCLKLTSGQR